MLFYFVLIILFCMFITFNNKLFYEMRLQIFFFFKITLLCVRMSKIPTWRGSPWGQPHSGPRGQDFFLWGWGRRSSSRPVRASHIWKDYITLNEYLLYLYIPILLWHFTSIYFNLIIKYVLNSSNPNPFLLLTSEIKLKEGLCHSPLLLLLHNHKATLTS